MSGCFWQDLSWPDFAALDTGRAGILHHALARVPDDLQGLATQAAGKTQDLHRAGACGDASVASAEKGEQVAHIPERLVMLLREVSKYPLDASRAGIDADAWV